MSRRGSACRGDSGVKHKPAAEMARTVGRCGIGWWRALRLLGAQPRKPSQPSGPCLMSAACETLVRVLGGDPRMSNMVLAPEESAA